MPGRLSRAVIQKVGANGEISKDQIQVDCDFERKEIHRADSLKIEDGQYFLSLESGEERMIRMTGSSFTVLQ